MMDTIRSITQAVREFSFRLRLAWFVIPIIAVSGGVLSGSISKDSIVQSDVVADSSTSTFPKETTSTANTQLVRESPSTVPSTTNLPVQIPAEGETMLLDVNKFRSDNDVGSLVWCPTLAVSALRHSSDMANRQFFDHINPDGADPFARMLAAGYGEYGGENIAVGYETVQSVMEGWINSPGHRANLLDPTFVEFGEGHVTGNYRGSAAIYWTQNFGSQGNCQDIIEEYVPVDSVPYIELSDPRFDTCREANSNGYGPYISGIDQEYDWYRDRDGDGIVCERG